MELAEFSQQLGYAMEEVGASAECALRDAARDEPALAGLAALDLVSRAHDSRTPLHHQDELWGAVLRCYRRNPDHAWTAILLEMLAPELVDLASKTSALHPRRDPCDIQQQLVLETLQIVRRMRAVPARYVKLRLSSRIRRKLRKRLGRKPKFSFESYEHLAEEQPGSLPTLTEDGVWELAEISGSKVQRRDLALASLEFTGQTIEEFASEIGCSAEALRSRIRRAHMRIQEGLAA